MHSIQLSESRLITSDVGQDGLRDCFRTPIPEIFQAADLLSQAVNAHLAGDTAEAQILLRQADMPILGEWIDPIWLSGNGPIRSVRKVDGLPPVLPKPERHSPRDATPDMKRALIARDGHHCRLCGIPLVRPEVRKLLNSLYPEAARWTSINAPDQHRGLQVLWLQYDHVIVHSRGGLTSMDNLVVACAACNYGRDKYMMAQVGLRDPRIHPRLPQWHGAATWDGLERLLPEKKRFAMQNEPSPVLVPHGDGAIIELTPGQAHDVDLPLRVTIAASMPNDVRLTAVMIPMSNGRQVGEGIVAADLPLGNDFMDILVDTVRSDARSTLHLVATRNGVEIPLSEVGNIKISMRSEGDVARALLTHTTCRLHVVAEIYDRQGTTRMRLVDQGYDRTWNEQNGTMLTGFALDEILEATAEEWRSGLESVPAAIENVNEEACAAPASTSPSMEEASLSDLPRMPCDLLYFSQKDGTSLRTVQIVSKRDDSIWAKAIDGRQVKQFKVAGITQLIDTETGEDMLPQLLLAVTGK